MSHSDSSTELPSAMKVAPGKSLNTSRRINPLFHSGDIESRITHERSVALNDAQ